MSKATLFLMALNWLELFFKKKYTVWKSKNFLAAQILREINYSKVDLKTCQFDDYVGSYIWNWKTALNAFHVISVSQKNFQIFTLWKVNLGTLYFLRNMRQPPITGYLQDSKNSMLLQYSIEAQRVIDLYKVLVNGIKCGKPKTATTVLTLFVCLR